MVENKNPSGRWFVNTTGLMMLEAYLNLNQGAKLREWIDVCKQYAGEHLEYLEHEVAKLLEKYKKD
jgi:FMN-dependent NADH-azoreductase